MKNFDLYVQPSTVLCNWDNSFFFVIIFFAGKYTFAISSDDSSELWLSSDENPSNVKLIAWVGNRTLLSGVFKTKIAEFTKYKTQMSRPVFLHKGKKYFIEVLHKQGSLQDHVLVGWKIPGLSHFRHLSGKSISLFINDSKASKDVTVYAQFIPQDLPSHSHYKALSIRLDPSVFKFGSEDLRDKAHRANFVDERDTENLFPSCPYKPSYLVDFKLKRYEGVTLIHDSAVYPTDNTDLTHMKRYDDTCALQRLKDSHGNNLRSLPPKLKSKQSLYENGSIIVFRSGNGFLPLSFAKSATEKEQAEEELLEMQIDIRDIKKRSQEVEDAAQPENTVPRSKTPRSLSQKDGENVFEMKKKAKRKNIVPLKRRKRSTSTNDKESSYNKDGMITKKNRPRQGSRVGSKDASKHDRRTSAHGGSRDKDSRDFVRDRSNGVNIATPVGTQRRLLSFSADKKSSSINGGEKNVSLQTNSYLGDYNSYSSRSQRGRNSSYGNIQQRRGRAQFYPINKLDDLSTRMNAAREFVRKMADVVQRYNHRVNSRSVAEAVYKKFGVTLKIPNLIRVPEYDAWIFHQNSTKCASDGNLLLNNDVSMIYLF